MQIVPETIIWNQPSATSRAVVKQAPREVFRLEKIGGDRINGSMPVWNQPQTAEERISSGLSEAADPAETNAASLAEAGKPKDDGFGFTDLIDMINPLQHIPFVSSIYRHLTGDEIGPVARVVGDTAFGGPIGAASGVVNALVQMETGKDVGENMLASVSGTPDKPSSAPDTTLALVNLRAPLAERVPVYNS